MAISTENIELLMKDKSVDALKLLLENVGEKYGLDAEELLSVVSGNIRTDDIPLSAFSNRNLSALEIIVKYLKENRGKKYSEIAKLLNRDDRTIWSTYSNSKKKYGKELAVQVSGKFIPLSIFSSRHRSVLESLVSHLKDSLNFSFNEIADLLSKDYQTVYTSYRRGRQK